MSITGQFSGVPQAVSTSLANLDAAISAAMPGTVITVTAGGAPRSLTLSSINKAEPGIAVALRPEHKIALIASGNCGVHFDGGHFVGDEIVGEGPTSSGARLTTASRIWFNAARFGKSDISVFADRCTDIAITDSIFEFGRGDAIQSITCERMRFQNILVGEQTFYPQFAAYNNGDLPTEGQAEATAAGAGAVYWVDSAHADLMQLRDGLIDALITGWDVPNGWYGQALGVWTAFLPGNFTRVSVQNNNFRSDHSASLYVEGPELEIIDNTFGPHPTADATSRQVFRWIPQGGDPKIRLGGNTLLPSSWGSMLLVGIPGGQSPTGAYNGPAISPPNLSGMHKPSWFPRSARPALTAPGIPVPMIVGPQIVGPFTGASINANTFVSWINTVGTWLSCNPRGWTSRMTASKEFRWTRNGTPISGETAQIYQINGADSGTTIGCEMRMTNSYGSSAWVAAASSRVIA